MGHPVRNWKMSVDETFVYPDIDNDDRVHFGPRAKWSELLVRSLGDRTTMVVGEIDFGYSAEETATLRKKLNVQYLSPLMAETLTNTISVDVDSASQHKVSVRLLNSLPFPRLQLDAALDHSVPGYEDVLREFETGWEDRNIFSGTLSLRYRMVDALIAYCGTLDYRVIVKEVAGELGTSASWQSKLYQSISDYVEREHLNIVKSQFPDGSRPYEGEVKGYIVERIIADAFYSEEVLLDFDAGQRLRGRRLREPETLGDLAEIRLSKTEDVAETITVLGN